MLTQTNELTLSKVTVANELTLQYAAQGPATGDAVLMLHGYSDTWFSFSRVLPLLPSSMRAVAPDQRGHGASDRPTAGYEIDDLATDAIQLLDALSIPRTVVVGHSMGSFVARRVAALAPDRVRALVLLGAGANARNQSLQELRSAVDGLGEPVDVGFVTEFQMSTVHRPVPADFMARVIADSARMPASVWKAMLAGLMDYKAAERDIRCRTLVLGGAHDGVFSEAEQEDLAGRINGANVKIFPGIGHTLHWEDPEAFARELVTFVRQV